MKYTYDEIDRMNCEELKSLINEDALLPDSEQMNSEELLYILQCMEIKGDYADSFSDTDAARETFLDVYHPKKKRFSFQDFGKRTKVLKTACIVLLMMLFFALGEVTAEAARFGFEKPDIRWTDESFSFSGIDGWKQGIYIAGDFDTLPVLEPYQKLLIEHSKLEDIMVTYLPGVNYVLEYTYKEGLQNFELKIELYKMSDRNFPHIVLWYNEPRYTGKGYEYPKDPGRPEEYVTNGITHYLMTNDGLWQALWTNGRIECCISGVESKEDLIKMIDSIYVRDGIVHDQYILGD